MAASTHDPCVCVQVKSGGVYPPEGQNTLIARQRRVCGEIHTVPVLPLLLWWWCVCCRCNVDSVVSRHIYTSSNVQSGVVR